jgi:endonuclease III
MNNAKAVLNYIEKRYGRHVTNSRQRRQKIFELLIETVLSQRTRDENSAKAAEQLFKVARTPRQISKLPTKSLQKLIRISGPYRQKAARIKSISKTILEDYDGKVPGTRDELMKFPGVGLKTSAIVLMYGFGIPAIAVDVHVEQISKRLGLVTQNSKPLEIEMKLEELFLVDKWYIVNLGFVMFGKEICLTRNPRCNICPLLAICPYGTNYGIKRFQE